MKKNVYMSIYIYFNHFAIHQKLTQHCKSSISSVQWLSRVRLFVTPWTAVPQASLPITNSQNLLQLMYIELVMPSNYLIIDYTLIFKKSGSVSSCLSSLSVISFPPLRQEGTPLLEAF